MDISTFDIGLMTGLFLGSVFTLFIGWVLFCFKKSSNSSER